MNRRKIIQTGGLTAAAAAALATPALAQTANPEIKWRLTSSFPKSLDTIFGAAEFFANPRSDRTRDFLSKILSH